MKATPPSGSQGGRVLSPSGDLVGLQSPLDPKLNPLQDNGGPTKTHTLLEGSPAISAGDQGAAPDMGQLGISRPQ